MKKKRFLTTLAAAALAVSMLSAIPASAANYPEAKWAAGDTKELKKYLVLDKTANVPEAKFSYTIAAGTPANYTTPTGASGTIAAYAGVDADKITIADAEFTSSSATTNGAADDGITNSTAKKYAVDTFSVDFSAVKFKEPGVYRYVVTETGAGATDDLGTGIKHVGNYQKTLDVYVKDTDGTLSVESYILYNSVIDTAPAISDDTALDDKVDRTDTANVEKTDGFVNEYSSKSLSFAKKVTGNQGSKDKYFKFTVEIKNAKGATLTIDPDKSSFEQTTTQNSATIYNTADMNAANGVDQNNKITGQQLNISSNSATYDFYLQNDQYITLVGLPTGAEYEITEAAEEYTSTATADETGKKFTIGTIEFKDETSGTIGTADVAAGFTNTKDGTIPTGVILSIAGPAVVGLAVAGGLIFMLIKRKKEDAED